MSQFDCYTTAEYLERIRKFLCISKTVFAQEAGMTRAPDKEKGRLKGPTQEALQLLEERVNEKSGRCEAPDTTFGERLRLARDYLGWNDANLAKVLGCSRELVRRWGSDIHRPTCIPVLAETLKVPEAWLADGGEDKLPADSHLGLRIGEEAKLWREELYAQELTVLAELPDEADLPYTQAFIENAIMSRPELANIARRAGGRWHSVGATLLWAPWVPIAEHGLSRRHWSDEVEAMIETELATQPTVYGAYNVLVGRWKSMGLTEDQYPSRITLHKRVEKDKARIERFGVNLNDMVAESVSMYPQLQV